MRRPLPILTTAALSIAGLIVATGIYSGNTIGAKKVIVDRASLEPREMPTYVPIEDSDGNGSPDWQDELARAGITFATTTPSASSTDPFEYMAADVVQSLYGGYLSLKKYGSYSPERGAQLGSSVAASIRSPQSFVPHGVAEIIVSEGTTESDVLRYRADMREALAPMITDAAPEFELFALYLETKDTSWLAAIGRAAQGYAAAEKNMLTMSVPKDAVPEHLRAVNSIGAYGSTLEHMSRLGGDNAFASIALLKTQSEGEQQLFLAFDSLAKYYVRKVTN